MRCPRSSIPPSAPGAGAHVVPPVVGRAWQRALSSLVRFYSTGRWRVPVLRERGADPFLVLVSTLLSHRTRDEVTKRATIHLLAKFPTSAALSKASPHEVRALIREVGLSRAKAQGLCAAARTLVSEFGGRVPESEADLLRIPRVGPKTAHAVRVFGYQRPGIPVDAHILRVARRMGTVSGRTIPRAQAELSTNVPERLWGLLNPVVVQHGMNICRARGPLCPRCPIEELCPKVGVVPLRVPNNS